MSEIAWRTPTVYIGLKHSSSTVWGCPLKYNFTWKNRTFINNLEWYLTHFWRPAESKYSNKELLPPTPVKIMLKLSLLTSLLDLPIEEFIPNLLNKIANQRLTRVKVDINRKEVNK